MIQEALEYATQYHLPVFPLKGKKPLTEHGCKDATIDQKQIKAWWDKFPSANVGIACGQVIVIDVDQDESKGEYGMESLHDLERELGELPDTWRCLTGGGGLHIYFKCPDGVEIRNSASKIADNIDIRGLGGYIVAPPSLHPETHKPYEWELEPEEIDLAILPDAWLQAIQGTNRAGEDSKYAEPETVPEGQRNQEIFKYGASLRARNISAIKMYRQMQDFNSKKCIPPIDAKELDIIYDSVMRYAQGTPQAEIIEQEEERKPEESMLDKLIRLDAKKRFQANDKSRGRLFSAVFGGEFRFNPLMNDYMWYDGRKWVKDTGSIKAREAAQRLSDELIKYAVNVVEDDENRSYLKAVSKLSNRSVRETMILDARVNNPISTEELDQNDYLLNVQNGTLDVSGDVPVFREHKPDDLLSKICNASYDPSAKCPEWERFLSEIMQGDTDKIKYLQKIAGLSLTGNTEQESCFILYGSTTRNGKSTFCETLIHMLGGYALTMKPETLATKQNNDSRSPSGDIARLAGARFVNASEPPKRMLFDTALLKTLLGRDSIVARHLHEREFEFIPKFKLVINTNYLPLVSDDSVFSSGRINVIAFDRHFKPEEQDRQLKSRLKQPEEMSGILNWCLEGLRLYRSEGLKQPEAVKDATESYRSDSDKIGNFISECLTKAEKNIKAGDVYKKYAEWCSDAGYGTESKSNFFAELKTKGIFKKSGRVDGRPEKNVISGYVIAEPEEPFMKVDPQMELPFD